MFHMYGYFHVWAFFCVRAKMLILHPPMPLFESRSDASRPFQREPSDMSASTRQDAASPVVASPDVSFLDGSFRDGSLMDALASDGGQALDAAGKLMHLQVSMQWFRAI